jgi:hypothetical protein
MNPKPASGSAASSFIAPSDTAQTGSMSAHQFTPIQKILIEIFKPAANLIQHEKVTGIRLNYAKYLAIQKIIQKVGNMEQAATWVHPKPTLQDIIEVFQSRSGYFKHSRQLFPRVENLPQMKLWLEGGEDAPEEKIVWGGKKPCFKNLEDILDSHDPSYKKKNVTKEKGKQSSSKSEVVVKGKGKEKANAKKAGEGSKKKADSRKSRQNAD